MATETVVAKKNFLVQETLSAISALDSKVFLFEIDFQSLDFLLSFVLVLDVSF